MSLVAELKSSNSFKTVQLMEAYTIDATIGVFGCPPTIVKSQPQLLKTYN